MIFLLFLLSLRHKFRILLNMNRSQEIIRTSWIGIVTNVLLAGFKAAVGILASSVAIVMDHNYCE